MPKIFISYRRDDSEDVTGRIHDHLTRHFGHEAIFMDMGSIPMGVDFRQHLQKAVGQCDILLAVIGDRWLDVCHQEGPKAGQRRLDEHGDFVRIEVQAALDRGIPVIPVLVGKATMPGEAMLPQQLQGLAYRNATEVRSGRDFHVHMDRLVRGIEHLASHETASQATEPKQPTRWEVAVPGWWYARTAGDSSMEWRKVTETPARVTVVQEEEYRLKLIPRISDEQLSGLAHLKRLTSLHSLGLKGCKLVTGAGLAHLTGRSFLQDLDLSTARTRTAGTEGHAAQSRQFGGQETCSDDPDAS
jgi:TIR domain-containing protein